MKTACRAGALLCFKSAGYEGDIALEAERPLFVAADAVVLVAAAQGVRRYRAPGNLVVRRVGQAKRVNRN